MRNLVLAALILTLVGCDDPAPESDVSLAEPTPPVAIPEEPVEEAPPADQAPSEEPAAVAGAADPGAQAAAAYTALREAFRRGDADAYIEAYTNPVECFFGQASVTPEALTASRGPQLATNAGTEEPMRIETIQLDVASASADEVELIDHGWTGRAGIDGDTVFHAKRIVMVRDHETWRVEIEAPATSDACGRGTLTYETPALWTYLRGALSAFSENCFTPEGGNPDDYPGIGGSIGCSPDTAFQRDFVWCAENHGERSEAECVEAVSGTMRTFYGEHLSAEDADAE